MKSLEQACYEAIVAFEAQQTRGLSFPSWDELPEDEKESYRTTAFSYRDNPNKTAEDGHAEWRASRRAKGWVYGPYRQVSVRGDETLIRKPEHARATFLSGLSNDDLFKEEMEHWKQQYLEATSIAEYNRLNPPKKMPKEKVEEVFNEAIKIASNILSRQSHASTALRGLRNGTSEYVMIHPSLCIWESLTPDQREKFEVFHRTVRNYRNGQS